MERTKRGSADGPGVADGTAPETLAGRLRNLPLLDRYVVVAAVVQLAGYAALSALVPHSEFAAVVEPLQRVPPMLLIPVAVLAVPAVAVAIAFGAALSAVGLQPTVLLVFLSVYLVSVASAWTVRRVRRRGTTTNP